MPEHNRRMVLAERPSGTVAQSTVRLEETEVPTPGEGQALVRTQFLSIDPTIRTWMDDAPGYLPPIQIDEVVRGAGVAEVVQSNSERYQPGSLVLGESRGHRAAAHGPGSGTACRLREPLSADPRAHENPAVPAIRSVVRHDTDFGLAYAVQCRRGGLRALAHSPGDLARRRQVHGSIRWLPARVAGVAAPWSQDRRTSAGPAPV